MGHEKGGFFRPASSVFFLRVSRLRIRSSAGREPKGSERTSVDLFVQLCAEPSRETTSPRSYAHRFAHLRPQGRNPDQWLKAFRVV